MSVPHTKEDIVKLLEAGSSIIGIGDDYFAARCAGVFSREEMEEAIDLIHQGKGKCVVFVNRMLGEEEIDRTREYLGYLKSLEVDYVLYNDPAVYVLADEIGMVPKLIYQPDTLMTNSKDVNFMLRQGVDSVFISKELTFEEIMGIASSCKDKCNVIIHGYLNMSYSKRKLLKSYFEMLGKEVDYQNRDLRLIEYTRTGKMPVYEDEQGTHIFTDYVLESFKEIKALSECVKFLMVDSMFLDIEVVIEAVKAYKAILVGADPEVVEMSYKEKYSELPLSDGYHYTKTNLVK